MTLNIFIFLFWNRNDCVDTSSAYFLKIVREYEPEMTAVNQSWRAQAEQPLREQLYITIEYMQYIF